MYLDYGENKLTLQELLIDKQFPNVSPSTCDAAFLWIVQNQEYCYFVFDGLDQATWSLENVQPVKEKYATPMLVQQLVANLCSKLFLGKSTLIITSRPHSLLSMPLKLRPESTVYVNDFSTDDMKALFYFYAGEKASKLWEKLQAKSPQILDFCHNPMLLQYVVYANLRDNAEHINTMTDIFDAVLQQLVNSEHAQGYDLDQLKKPLGKMAYKGMLRRSVVFHSKDLEEVGLQDVNVQDVVIKVARYSWVTNRKVFKGSEVLFYCSHQTLQEVFAAYYICLFMPLVEFQQVVKQVVNGGHWSMVRRFMCGVLLGNTNDSSSNEATTSQHQGAGDCKRKDAQPRETSEVPFKKQKISTSVGLAPSESTTLQVEKDIKITEHQEKRNIFLEELTPVLSSDFHRQRYRNNELLELLLDLQECCEAVKDQLGRFCPRKFNFSDSVMSIARCHALGDFLSRITTTGVKLRLGRCDLDCDKLQQICNGMKNMQVKLKLLNLCGNKKLEKNAVETITGIFTKVRKLRLDGCELDSETIGILKENLSKLEDPPKVVGLSEEGQSY